jgi:hypothetical protein
MDFIAVLLTAGVKLTNTLFLLLFLQSRRLNVYPKKFCVEKIQGIPTSRQAI